MPRSKGPEKRGVKLWLTLRTIAWLERKAGNRPVPTYLAERIERQAANGMKNALLKSPPSTHTSDGSPDSTENGGES
jgi:hypothetical protein